MSKLIDILKKNCSKDDIKIFALIFMGCDHTALYLANAGAELGIFYFFCRCFGRLAFPMFAFCLVDGYLQTSSRKKYLTRLIVWAFISEIPYNLFISGKVIDWTNKNVLFTYVIGFLLIDILRWLVNPTFWKYACCIVAFMVSAQLLGVDYGALGILLIALYYIWPVTEKKNWGFYILIAGLFVFAFGCMSIFIIPAFYYLTFYDASDYRKTKRDYLVRIIFYVFYPLHMLIGYLFLLIVR